MRRILALVLIFGVWLGCGGPQQAIKPGARQPMLPDHWRLEVVSMDLGKYPQVMLRAVVKDSAGQVVKNLAPPFGHLNDWQQVWRPLLQTHPRWGQKELLDFKVIETQFEGIDTTTLVRLRQEKNQLELQLSQGREAFKLAIERIQERKRQLPSPVRELTARTSVVLVMDVSGSMSGEPLELAKLAAAEFLEFSDASIALIAFDDKVNQLTTFSRDKGLLTSLTLQLQSGGGTHLYDALYAALQLLQETKGEKHILALSDGQTGGDRYSLMDIIRLARAENVSVVAQTGEKIKLFTIGLGYPGGELKELAEKTGGKYYYTGSATDLLDIFSDYIGFQLEQTRTDLTLSYRLGQINLEIEQILKNIIKNFHYDISFTSAFPEWDGTDQEISFNFGQRTLRQRFRAPVSPAEMVVLGQVVDDEDGEKIPEAVVTINPQQIDTTHSAVTDSSGQFALKVKKTFEKYTVFVRAKDHFVSTRETLLAHPDSYYVHLRLPLPRIKPGVTAVIRTIHFENNEFLFEPISFPDLLAMASFLTEHPEMHYEISGHTDSYGDASYNQWLSEKRAEAVAEFFIGLGVPESHIRVKGFGEAKLLAPDDSEENRYLNRRVEIKLTEIDAVPPPGNE